MPKEHSLVPSSGLTSIQASLNLVSLVTRRLLIDVSVLSKIVRGTIDCSDLLHLFNFHIPTFNSRSIPTFAIPFHHTSYGANNPIDRISRVLNRLNNYDMFI